DPNRHATREDRGARRDASALLLKTSAAAPGQPPSPGAAAALSLPSGGRSRPRPRLVPMPSGRRSTKRPYGQPHPELDVDRVLGGAARREIGPRGEEYFVATPRPSEKSSEERRVGQGGETR